MASGSRRSWWRAWSEAAHDPKLRALPHRLHTYWFRLLCLACTDATGTLPRDVGEIATWLHVDRGAASRALAELHRRGLLDASDGMYTPHNWQGRQYLEGSSTERVRRFRKRFHETPPEQSRAETEKKERERGAHNGEHPPNGFAERKIGAYLPEDWQPSEEDLTYARNHHLDGQQLTNEAEKFRKHWHGEAGQKARKRNWHAAWCKWVLNARPGSQPRPNQPEGFRF